VCLVLFAARVMVTTVKPRHSTHARAWSPLGVVDIRHAEKFLGEVCQVQQTDRVGVDHAERESGFSPLRSVKDQPKPLSSTTRNRNVKHQPRSYSL
jgi:hypothetical protein